MSVHPCEGCRYFFGHYQQTRFCNYIFLEGHRRPCPPGKACTVKAPITTEKQTKPS